MFIAHDSPHFLFEGVGLLAHCCRMFQPFQAFFLSFFLPLNIFFIRAHAEWTELCVQQNAVRSKFFRLMPENNLRRARMTEQQLIRSMSRPRLH